MTHILVIDDDASIRQVIVLALGDEGYEVEEAANGLIGLEQIERRHPDLILVDMRMPCIDGREFVQRYRERHGHRAPILVLTAAQDADQQGVAVDAEAYVSKPFDLDDLLLQVAALAGPR